MPQTAFHVATALATAAVFYGMAAPLQASEAIKSPASDALASGALGLYSSEQFRLTTGNCTDCQVPPQALWYFGNGMVAVARDGAAGFSPRLRAQDDVRAWLAANGGQPRGEPPALVWIGSPHVTKGRLESHGGQLRFGGALPRAVALAPRLATNRSYFDHSSLAFFGGQEVKARGVQQDGRFVAHTLWPQRYAIAAAAPSQPLAAGETLEGLVRAQHGGATAPFGTRTLWRRDGGAQALSLAGKPVLAFVLNGAQGDDDEAHGGHFAVATGRFGPAGQWDNWLVNNFYSLGSVSEKGIIASILPMDAYLADINSGQSWYRPSYMLVAVLKDQRTPAVYQEAVSRVFHHFYRQDFQYRHATANCAGISVATLRTLGWEIPRLGGESPLKAAIALPYMALKEGSLASGQSAYDYLKTERTELLPFAAFNSIGEDLLGRLAKGGASTGLEGRLGQDLEALLFVRIPQIPSSRAAGADPVLSLSEYERRAPADRADWKIVPVAARPFPAALKDAGAPPQADPESVTATWIWGGVALAALAGAGLAVWRRWRRPGAEPAGERERKTAA